MLKLNTPTAILMKEKHLNRSNKSCIICGFQHSLQLQTPEYRILVLSVSNPSPHIQINSTKSSI